MTDVVVRKKIEVLGIVIKKLKEDLKKRKDMILAFSKYIDMLADILNRLEDPHRERQ